MHPERTNNIKPISFHLQWHITERCNLKCKHCYFDKRFLENELSLSQLLRILKQYLNAIDRWGLSRENSRISITGGEPLVRKDIFQLLEKLKAHNDKCVYSLMSNGTLINRKIARKIKEFGVSGVQVSLEGIGKANDEIRGPRSFERAEKGINALLDEGVKIAISTTVTKNNVSEVHNIVEFCLTHNINFLGIRRLVPIGRGLQIRKAMLEPKQVRDLYKYIMKKNKELEKNGAKLKIMIGCEDGIFAQEKNYEPHGCNTGYYSFSVLPNGDVYPCRRLPILCGNILKDGFWNIYYKSEEIKNVRASFKAKPELCKKCPFWEKCLGGAKCISYGYFNNLTSPDPQCWRLFKKLP